MIDEGGELVGLYGEGPAFINNKFTEALGLQHTTAVIKGIDGKFYNSLSGFGAGNIYAATAVCHNMTNQAFLQAGYANTVAGFATSSWSTYFTSIVYTNYGSPSLIQANE